jgi:hypothetical protein
MSRAFTLFETTSKRSHDVFMIANHWYDGCPKDEFYKENKPTYEDMGRAGIVLSVAAMDAYFTRRFTEILGPYLKAKGPSDDLVALLQAAGFDTRQALELLTMERPYRRIRSLVDSHLERYTTQRFDAIDRLFLCFGLKSLCANAQSRSRRATLLRSVEILVERRHEIVHTGDHDKHGKIVPLDFTEFAKRIRDLNIFVQNADEIITSLESKFF